MPVVGQAEQLAKHALSGLCRVTTSRHAGERKRPAPVLQFRQRMRGIPPTASPSLDYVHPDRKPGRFLAGATLAIATCMASGFAAGRAHADPLLTYPLKIKGHAVRAELAVTEEDKRVGLMFRRSLGEGSGMLFVYEREGRWAMWMKNTYVPLSVAFIDVNGRILNIEDMAPLTEDTHQASGPAKYALEMNRGWFAKHGIRPGDRVQGLDKLPR
jgi:uncharacterized membrane protein (UPF0127 family)